MRVRSSALGRVMGRADTRDRVIEREVEGDLALLEAAARIILAERLTEFAS